tara:strand:- start:9957 stop:10277 length:321 start_codon:yes stop_codon:yes gene_type:complete
MESRWKTQDIKKLEGIKVGTLLTIVYQAIVPLPPIKEVKSSCGCSEASFDPETNQVRVVYKAEKIPKHLIAQGWFLAAKKIGVIYENETPDRLTFTIKVVQDGLPV